MSEFQKFYIYALTEPKDPTKIRYIGKANDLKYRFKKEIKEAEKYKNKTHRNYWIRSVLNKGLFPNQIVIQECSNGEDWKERETYRIKYHRDNGYDLMNETDGGMVLIILPRKLEKRLEMQIEEENFQKRQNKYGQNKGLGKDIILDIPKMKLSALLYTTRNVGNYFIKKNY